MTKCRRDQDPRSSNHFRAKAAAARGTVAVFAVDLATNRARGHLPEPFDVFNHVPNAAASIGVGAGVNWAAQWALTRGGYPQRPVRHPSRVRGAGVAAGMLGVAVANAVWEARWGLPSVSAHLVGDPVDFWYGIMGGALGASIPPPAPDLGLGITD